MMMISKSLNKFFVVFFRNVVYIYIKLDNTNI